MQLPQDQTGYTLIELLLYSSIVGALLLAVTSFFALSAEARVKNQSISEVNSQGTALMEQITQSVRNATDVTAPTIGTSGSSLTLTVPTGANSPTIYNLSSSTAQVKEGAAAAVALTNSRVQVTSLTFKNLARSAAYDTIQISFTLARSNSNNRNEYDYTKTFIGTASLRP